MSVLPLATFSAPGVPLYGSAGTGSYTAGSNITITNDVIATTASPSFTNVTTTSINGSAYFPINYTLLTQTNNNSVIAAGGNLTITSPFNLTGGRCYRITLSYLSLFNTGSPGGADIVKIQLAGQGVPTTVLGNAPITFYNGNTQQGGDTTSICAVFKAPANYSGVTIQLINTSPNLSATYFGTGGTIAAAYLLEDLGPVF